MSDERGKKMTSVQMDMEEFEEIKRAASAEGVNFSTFMRDAGLAKARGAEAAKPVAKPTPPTEPLPCGCSDATHQQAEWRVANELAPRLRRKIAPRDAAEGPHEYIARYWAADELKRDFFVDLHTALGWIKDDEAEVHEDYD